MRAEDEFLAAFEKAIRANGFKINRREVWDEGYRYVIDDVAYDYLISLVFRPYQLERAGDAGNIMAAYVIGEFLQARKGDRRVGDWVESMRGKRRAREAVADIAASV